MSSTNYKVKYLKYKTKYLDLLKKLYNNKGGNKSNLEEPHNELHPNDGVTSAVNGKLGISQKIIEGTAGDGKLCKIKEDCPKNSFCNEGNCKKEEKPLILPKRKKTEEERIYEEKIRIISNLSRLSK